MSLDSADDIHAAEDLAGTLAHELTRWLEETDGRPSAEAALAGWQMYCRPSCGGEGDPCDDEDCGCPCHQRTGISEG